MNSPALQKLALVVGTAALVAYLFPRLSRFSALLGPVKREEPVETGRWESEGGNVSGSSPIDDDEDAFSAALR